MTERDQGDQPWLSAEQLRAWQSVMAMMMTLPAALDAQLRRDAGINTFDYHVLVGLSERPDGSMGMGELALLTQASPSRLSHAVSRLERAGWIERQSGAARCVNAHLTTAGRQKLAETAPGHVREVRRLVIEALTAEQLEAFGVAALTVAGRADPMLIRALDVQRSGDRCTDAGCTDADCTNADCTNADCSEDAEGCLPC